MSRGSGRWARGDSFPFENKGDVMPLDEDSDIDDVDRHIDRTAEIDFGILLNMPQVLAKVHVTRR